MYKPCFFLSKTHCLSCWIRKNQERTGVNCLGPRSVFVCTVPGFKGSWTDSAEPGWRFYREGYCGEKPVRNGRARFLCSLPTRLFRHPRRKRIKHFPASLRSSCLWAEITSYHSDQSEWHCDRSFQILFICVVWREHRISMGLTQDVLPSAFVYIQRRISRRR